MLLVWHSGGAEVLECVLDGIVCGWPIFTSSAAGEVFQEPGVRGTVDLELKAIRLYFCGNFWNATGRVLSRLMQWW